MSVEEDRFNLRRRAHEANITHLKRQVELKKRELAFFETYDEPVLATEPQLSYENDEEIGLLRLDMIKSRLDKELNELLFEIENNELALRDLVEQEDTRSNRH